MAEHNWNELRARARAGALTLRDIRAIVRDRLEAARAASAREGWKEVRSSERAKDRTDTAAADRRALDRLRGWGAGASAAAGTGDAGPMMPWGPAAREAAARERRAALRRAVWREVRTFIVPADDRSRGVRPPRRARGVDVGMDVAVAIAPGSASDTAILHGQRLGRFDADLEAPSRTGWVGPICWRSKWVQWVPMSASEILNIAARAAARAASGPRVSATSREEAVADARASLVSDLSAARETAGAVWSIDSRAAGRILRTRASRAAMRGLRAERLQGGHGRVDTVTVSAMDPATLAGLIDYLTPAVLDGDDDGAGERNTHLHEVAARIRTIGAARCEVIASNNRERARRAYEAAANVVEAWADGADASEALAASGWDANSFARWCRKVNLSGVLQGHAAPVGARWSPPVAEPRKAIRPRPAGRRVPTSVRSYPTVRRSFADFCPLYARAWAVVRRPVLALVRWTPASVPQVGS